MHHPLHHDLQQQMRERENQLLQREREQRQHEQHLQLHYREQQQIQKLREQERLRDQSKHRELMQQSGQLQIARENHIQPPPPHLHQAPPSVSVSSASSREVDSHSYSAAAVAAAAAAVAARSGSSTSARLTSDTHIRIQQIPSPMYTGSSRGGQPLQLPSHSLEQVVDNSRVMQSSSSTSTINYHRESPVASSLTKTETMRENTRSVSGNRPNSGSVPAGSGGPVPVTGGGGSGAAAGESSTLTAASLIDAIITHQINQPSNDGVGSATIPQPNASTHAPSQRPGDKLFQVFPEPDGKLSPLKCMSSQSRASPDVKPQNQSASSPQPPNQQSSPVCFQTSSSASSSSSFSSVSASTTMSTVPSALSSAPVLISSTNVATSAQPLGAASISAVTVSASQSQNISPVIDHHDPMVVAVSSAISSSVGGDIRSSTVYVEPHAWKLRRALQQKELEQNDRSIVRMASNQQRPASSTPPPIISSAQSLPSREKLGLGCPFDYVKNKIVEVMHRTSDDDGNKSSAGNNGNTVGGGGGGGNANSATSEDGSGTNSDQSSQQQPPYVQTTNYAYPYSALNINSQVPVPAHSTPAITPKPVDVPEPTPILSSQYEPLSDED